MTKEDIKTFDAMKKDYVQPNSANDNEFGSPVIDSRCIRKSNSDTTIISNLTDPNNNKNSDGTVSLSTTHLATWQWCWRL